MPGRVLAETVLVDSDPSALEMDASEQEAGEKDTFPAEVIVDQAYHLRVKRYASCLSVQSAFAVLFRGWKHPKLLRI